MELVGRKVSREFQGLGLLSGTVKSYDSTTGFFEIVYEDGDSEELEFSEVAPLLDCKVGDQIDVPELSKDQAGRKPKKRQRFSIDGDSGNDSVDLSSTSSLIRTVEIRDKDCVGPDGFVKTLEMEFGAREKCDEFVIMNKTEETNHRLNLNDELDLSNGVVSNHGLDLNAKLNLNEEDRMRKSNMIDLNLNLNEQDVVDSNLKDDDLGDSVVDSGKIERCFDLNLGLDDENKNLDVEDITPRMAEVDGNAGEIEIKSGNLNEILKGDDLEMVEETPLIGFSGSTESMMGDVIQKEDDNCSSRDQLTMESNENQGQKRKGRKRKKLSDTVLRRSSRRGSSSFSSHIHVSSEMELDSVDDNEFPSPSVSAVSDEKLTVSSVETEGQNSLSEKPNLPPSSEHLNLDGIPILDLFSVYSFLRSFSTSLFLSPFELEDFVAALRCKIPNLLFDFIHVSLLQTLRKHLEFLSVESSESASLCLRSLNWDLLDLITWPIYMIEYLLMHSTGSKPNFDLTQLKLFDKDYYQQPESLKIEILRCLCDDVIESESIRSELNRRLMGTETDTTDFDISKKRRAVNQENLSENQDWNSDECHLCKMDGNLICCDGCPSAFHSKCVGVAASSLPEGDWYCPECKDGQSTRVGKSTRGAELLGVDPYGRFYYSSCGYLLVSDSCETGSLFTYYHRDDLGAVIEALKSSYIFYGKILREITNLCNVSSVNNGAKSYTDSKNSTLIMPPPVISSEIINPEENMNTKMENPPASSEGSTEVSEAAIGIINPKRAYVNYYSFARISSSVFEKLARKSSDKISKKSADELLSAQLKVISNMPREFNWSNMENSSLDARKEKCGWCIHCKILNDDDEERDCLYIAKDSVHVLEGSSNNELLCLNKNTAKGHLADVIYQILCMEDRLRGLLVGPWLNPEYSKLWRENVVEASDVASLKDMLLMLESNLRHRAFSTEWVKHVETVATLGSASHIVNRFPKNGISRKKSRFSDVEPNSTSKSASGLSLFWWRGGRISRHLFNWKVLPHSLVSKAARQGGGKKIPGILYPDSSESAKRSKNLTWQASVQTSRSVEQLALQVRELDANIKWDEIENTKPLSKMDKESIKSFRSFKKVTIRRKSSEGKVVKYLLDFGKRRFIPDIVTKHSSIIEDSSSVRKKYWVEESHVPLHLLKGFEEKRISRKSNKINSEKILVSGLVQKKRSKKKGFSYLFSKAERSEFYRCGHCKKDVLIRDAVSCQICQGFFHKRHVKKSAGAITAECKYTCHQCQAGNHVKVDSKKSTSKLENNKKVNKIGRKSGKNKQSEQPQNNKKKNIVVVPLRRSTRKIKFVTMPSKKGRKRGRPKKVKKVMSAKQEKPTICILKKKRTLVYHAYWLKGLRLSNKPNDERPSIFKTEKKLLVVSEQSNSMLNKPRCVLCEEREFTSTLTYIGCEICGGWFHGDAFGLNDENIDNLIGFRCHNCRKRTPPLCPHATTHVKTPLDGSNEAVVKETT